MPWGDTVAAEDRMTQNILITSCAVLFILAGARAANRPAARSPYPLRITAAIEVNGGRVEHNGRMPPLVQRLLSDGPGCIVRIEDCNREPVAAVEFTACPGLSWGRAAVLSVIYRGIAWQRTTDRWSASSFHPVTTRTSCRKP